MAPCLCSMHDMCERCKSEWAKYWADEEKKREEASAKMKAEDKARRDKFAATTMPVTAFYSQFCDCCMKRDECTAGSIISKLSDNNQPTMIAPCKEFFPR